ncbi:MAG: GntR family transcriptional regulator [Pseudolabrys sp.]|nr:GntR family transcriptional regulator [Pseudolabrys sp.]
MSRSLARIGRAERESGHLPVTGGVTPPLRRTTIAAQIRALLRRDIISGAMLPRTMLSEQELSGRFSVSRTPIREALIKLSEEGLVEIYPQYGSFVAPIKLVDVYDAQFAREALECAAVEKASERLNENDDRQLEAILDRQRALVRFDEREAFVREDENMHALIMKIAGHASAWTYVEAAKVQMDRVRYLALRIPRKPSSILAEHVAVAEGLFARDRKRAVEAMRTHLRGIFKTLDILTVEQRAYFADVASARLPAARNGSSERDAGKTKSRHAHGQKSNRVKQGRN